MTVYFFHFTYAFRLNLHSAISSMSRNSLLEISAISENCMTATGFKFTITYWMKFVNECSTITSWHDKNTQSMHLTDKFSRHSSINWPIKLSLDLIGKLGSVLSVSVIDTLRRKPECPGNIKCLCKYLCMQCSLPSNFFAIFV